MTKAKNIVMNNQIFFLIFLAFTTTMLNAFIGIGVVLLILTALLIILPIYVWKVEDINYWVKIQLFLTKAEKTMNVKLAEIEENRAEKEVKRKEDEVRQEAEDFVRQLNEEKERKKEEEERRENILAQARSLMEEQGMEESEIVAVLEEKKEELMNQEKIYELYQEPELEQHAQQSFHQTHPNDVPAFEVEKSGLGMNILLLVIGIVPLGFIMMILANLFSFGILPEAIIGLFFFLILFSVVYYLPTLLYHVSLSGKILIFILNISLGMTVVAWAILLIYVITANKNHAHNQEMLHYQKHK